MKELSACVSIGAVRRARPGEAVAGGPASADAGRIAPDLHRYCFACGICNTGGLKLHFEVGADGVAEAEWKPSPRFESYPGRVHGGVVATLLDSSMVHALFARSVAGLTAELSIRYHHPVEIGCPAVIRGWVEDVRRGVYRCVAEIYQNDRRAVRADAKFMAMQGNGR